MGVDKTVAKAAVVRVTNPARTEIFMEDSRFERAISIKNISESRLAVGTRPGIVSRNTDPPCHSVTSEHPPYGEPHDIEWPLVSERELPLASHVITPRRSYLHHGIYVADGQVVHYAGLAHNLR